MQTLVFFNEAAYQTEVRNHERLLPVIEKPVSFYHKMGLPPLKKGELTRLFTDTEGLIFDKMTGGKEIVLAGLKVDKAKAMEIMVKPDGYTTLMQHIEDARRQFRIQIDAVHTVIIYPETIERQFELNGNGSVNFTESFLKSIKSKHEHYATSEKAKTTFEFLQKVAALYMDMEMAKKCGADIKQIIHMGLLDDNQAGRKLKPTINYRTVVACNNEYYFFT